MADWNTIQDGHDEIYVYICYCIGDISSTEGTKNEPYLRSCLNRWYNICSHV